MPCLVLSEPYCITTCSTLLCPARTFDQAWEQPLPVQHSGRLIQVDGQNLPQSHQSGCSKLSTQKNVLLSEAAGGMLLLKELYSSECSTCITAGLLTVSHMCPGLPKACIGVMRLELIALGCLEICQMYDTTVQLTELMTSQHSQLMSQCTKAVFGTCVSKPCTPCKQAKLASIIVYKSDRLDSV